MSKEIVFICRMVDRRSYHVPIPRAWIQALSDGTEHRTRLERGGSGGGVREARIGPPHDGRQGGRCTAMGDETRLG